MLSSDPHLIMLVILYLIVFHLAKFAFVYFDDFGLSIFIIATQWLSILDTNGRADFAKEATQVDSSVTVDTDLSTYLPNSEPRAPVVDDLYGFS